MPKTKKTSKIQKLLRTIGIVLLFLIPFILIIVFRKQISRYDEIIPAGRFTGPLVSILLMGVLSITPIPTDPIVVLNGAIFGPVTGVITSWMGNNLAAIIEYFIGRGLSEITDFEKQKNKLPFGLGKFPADSIWFLILGRLVPQFGGKLVSLAGGAYHVGFGKYLWTAAVSNLFGSILLALGGSYGLSLIKDL